MDTRIIAATNRNLAGEGKKMGNSGKTCISVERNYPASPAAAERREDIPVLINHFLDNFCKNKRKKTLLPGSNDGNDAI